MFALLALAAAGVPVGPKAPTSSAAPPPDPEPEPPAFVPVDPWEGRDLDGRKRWDYDEPAWSARTGLDPAHAVAPPTLYQHFGNVGGGPRGRASPIPGVSTRRAHRKRQKSARKKQRG